MNSKLKNIITEICKYIFKNVISSEEHFEQYFDVDGRYKDYTCFQFEYTGCVEGVHFLCGGFAEGAVLPPDKRILSWIDLDFLQIREANLSQEEVEELRQFFNPGTTSFDLRDVIPDYFTPLQ